MYKVFVVDDEQLIRMALKKIITENTENFEICGEAANGEKGLEKIKELKPDIVITDICMNKMSGLEMIERIGSVIPRGKIIVLTGYRDFDYAQQAILLGVFRFFVKPMQSEEIIKAICEAASLIEDERKVKANDAAFNQNLPYIRQKLILDMMMGINIAENDEKKDMEAYCDIDIDRFYLLLVSINKEGSSKELYVLNCMFADLADTKTGTENIRVYIDYETSAVIIRADQSPEQILAWCNSILKYMKNIENSEIHVGISAEGVGTGDLFVKYQECKKSLSFAKYIGGEGAVLYSDIQNENINSRFYYNLQAIKENLMTAIETMDGEKITDYVNRMAEIKCGSSEMNLNIVKRTYGQIIMCMAEQREMTRDSGGSGLRLSGVEENIHKCGSKAELDNMLKLIADGVIQKTNDVNIKGISRKVQKITEYIENNYSKNIMLDDIAKYILVSSYHASRIFKKETGKNISDYVNEVRIKNAMRLLREKDRHVYEVAELVGIENTQYFSTLFKKYAGKTPTEYIESCRND